MLVLTFNEPIYLETSDGVIVIRKSHNENKIAITLPDSVNVVRESVMKRNAEKKEA